MNAVLRIATAFAAGATAMYFLDPVAGRRRRALVRDQGVAAGHDLDALARGKSRHLGDRLHGFVAEAKAAMRETPVSDQLLHDRVRTRLGRLVEAPGDIAVDVRQGRVILRGSAAPHEIEAVVDEVAGMRGVDGIDDHLVPASDALAYAPAPVGGDAVAAGELRAPQ